MVFYWTFSEVGNLFIPIEKVKKLRLGEFPLISTRPQNRAWTQSFSEPLRHAAGEAVQGPAMGSLTMNCWKSLTGGGVWFHFFFFKERRILANTSSWIFHLSVENLKWDLGPTAHGIFSGTFQEGRAGSSRRRGTWRCYFLPTSPGPSSRGWCVLTAATFRTWKFRASPVGPDSSPTLFTLCPIGRALQGWGQFLKLQSRAGEMRNCFSAGLSGTPETRPINLALLFYYLSRGVSRNQPRLCVPPTPGKPGVVKHPLLGSRPSDK